MADLDSSSVVQDIEAAYDSIQRGKTYLSSDISNERTTDFQSSHGISSSATLVEGEIGAL